MSNEFLCEIRFLLSYLNLLLSLLNVMSRHLQEVNDLKAHTICVGHTASVESVTAANPTFLVSGSYDKT